MRSAIRVFGSGYEITVQCGDYTDAEMIRMLGDNGYRDTPQSERIALVKLVAAFLENYNVDYSGPVDADLLKERVLLTKPFEGQEKVSHFLIPRLWPRSSIANLNVWGKPDSSKGSDCKKNNEPAQETVQTPIHPQVESQKEPEVKHVSSQSHTEEKASVATVATAAVASSVEIDEIVNSERRTIEKLKSEVAFLRAQIDRLLMDIPERTFVCVEELRDRWSELKHRQGRNT